MDTRGARGQNDSKSEVSDETREEYDPTGAAHSTSGSLSCLSVMRLVIIVGVLWVSLGSDGPQG